MSFLYSIILNFITSQREENLNFLRVVTFTEAQIEDAVKLDLRSGRP